MKLRQTLFAVIFIAFLVSCTDSPSVTPTTTLVKTLSQTPSKTFTPPATPTLTFTPTLTPTERPLTLVFYGDSQLKVGDASRAGSVGFSIVDVLQTDLNPANRIITSNHGGRKARWAYDNLDENVLKDKPDIVTIWWGINDLNGCPGIFDRATNKLVQYELTAMIDDHIHYMELQVDTMLKMHIPVIVVTTMPVLGTLPWTHFGPNNELVWENTYRCDFNLGLEQIVEAQRKMVSDYAVRQKPVFLVDAWQIYKDHPNTDNMYMDIVHPGQRGAELIADGWLQVFQTIKR